MTGLGFVLKTLRRGQIVTDSVTQTTDSGLTSVDIGGLTAMTSTPEAVADGQQVAKKILDINMARGRVSLTLKV